MILSPGPFSTVKPVERFKVFDKHLPIYACREVEKISSKGKRLKRVMVVSSTFTAFAGTRMQRIRRVILHKSLKSAAIQKAENGQLTILLQLNEDVNEPDILFQQTDIAEDPPSKVSGGNDILSIINYWRKVLVNEDLRIIDRTNSPKLNETNCNLKKTAAYETVQWKLAKGELTKHEQEPSIPSNSARGLDSAKSPPSESAPNTYTVQLTDPNGELGIDYEDERTPTQRVLLVKIDPKSPAGAAGVPCGVLQSVNSQPVDTSKQLRAVVGNLRGLKTTTYKFVVTALPGLTPMPLSNTKPGGNKLLAIGVGYLDSSFKLRNSASEARAIVGIMEGLNFCPQENIRILTEEPNSIQPTKANILENLKWLVSTVGPGDALFLCFVGHCMQQQKNEIRDGPYEALYPCDFNTRETGGVITEEELKKLIVNPLPAGAKLTVVCDSCSAGTLLNLPYKLKTTAEGGVKSTFQEMPVPAGKVLQLSSWKGKQPPAQSVIASGAIASGFCTAMSRDPEPTFDQLLSTVLQVVVSKVGVGSQTPQISCSWRASTNERFFPSIRRGELKPQGGGAIKAPTTSNAAASSAPASPMYRSSKHASPRAHPQSPQRMQTPAVQRQWQPGHMEELAQMQQQGFPSALRPDELLSKIPHTVLTSPGLSRLLTVQWQNGAPEIFYTAEVICMESRTMPPTYDTPNPIDSQVLWPSSKLLFVGREAVYLLDPTGEVDRCIPLGDLHDFILFKNGAALDKVLGSVKGPSMLPPGTVGLPWLAVRIPSQYELLVQPIEKGDPQNSIQNLLQVTNLLMQYSPSGAGPAKVLVVDKDVTPGLLRLHRPPGYSFPWIPLNVRVWPSRMPGMRRGTQLPSSPAGDPLRALAV
eukprot:TRINITY_DN7379_c0_g1_i1.p1 TRINITY_DN7379_c0_g1~~TRINITY_DN7379_c0_g1_i1.p1  ORF type:complete len:888 (+),score=169.77 TRINITY_DN7379_c0_g1_i1:55-2664(+)